MPTNMLLEIESDEDGDDVQYLTVAVREEGVTLSVAEGSGGHPPGFFFPMTIEDARELKSFLEENLPPCKAQG